MPRIAAPERYLFEPSPAFQKAGCFRTLAARHGFAQLHPNTHLYTGAAARFDFPGRAFEIVDVYPASAKKLPLRQANLAIRNFPSTVEILKKKLKLRDGGEDYLFACTLEDDRKALIHARKLKENLASGADPAYTDKSDPALPAARDKV
jgi:hypothetical protein